MTDAVPKKKRRARPAERTLEWLRKHGALCHKTEVWNPWGGPRLPDGSARGVRQDMWALVDVLALWNHRSDFVQACGTDVSSHITKIESSIDLQARLVHILTDWPRRRFFLICWRERQLKHQKRPEWVIRIIEFIPGRKQVEMTPEQYLATIKEEKPHGKESEVRVPHRRDVQAEEDERHTQQLEPADGT